MALERKSTHVRLDAEVDSMLAVLSDAADKDKAELAAALLTKSVVGEFHALRLAADRMSRLGISVNGRNSAEVVTSRRKSAGSGE